MIISAYRAWRRAERQFVKTLHAQPPVDFSPEGLARHDCHIAVVDTARRIANRRQAEFLAACASLGISHMEWLASRLDRRIARRPAV